MINSSSDNVKKLNSINRRMFITGSVKFFIMIGLVSRLFFLQVKENKKYLTLSDKNRIREWKLAPVRGEFHDYFGNVIAGNFEAYQLHIIPEQVEDFRYLIYRIKDLLELSDKEFKKIIKNSEYNYQVFLAKDLNKKDLNKFENDLRNSELCQLSEENDLSPTDIYHLYTKTLSDLLNIHAPLQTKVIYNRPNTEWFNSTKIR